MNRPVDNGTAKRFSGHWPQEVCPWNEKLAAELRDDAFRPRELLRDAGSRVGTRALAREILMMDAADYAAAFKGSAIKRAKLWMLERNACVVLGNVRISEDLPVLEASLADEKDIRREHAAWALRRIKERDATARQ